MRYGAGVIGWTKQELQKMERKTRKVLTMNKELRPKSDTGRFYVPRRRGGRGLTSCEDCVRTEENSFCWYVKNSNEEMLRKVDENKLMQNGETIEPKRHKNNRNQSFENYWRSKEFNGQHVREWQGADWDRTWQWLAKANQKGCTEGLVCSAQEQSLRTNYVKFRIYKFDDSPLCRMCGDKGESFCHLISEYGKLAQREC